MHPWAGCGEDHVWACAAGVGWPQRQSTCLPGTSFSPCPAHCPTPTSPREESQSLQALEAAAAGTFGQAELPAVCAGWSLPCAAGCLLQPFPCTSPAQLPPGCPLYQCPALSLTHSAGGPPKCLPHMCITMFALCCIHFPAPQPAWCGCNSTAVEESPAASLLLVSSCSLTTLQARPRGALSEPSSRPGHYRDACDPRLLDAWLLCYSHAPSPREGLWGRG